MSKKVMLLFPPEWVPTAPYLALPSITAVLRQNGIEVVQKDVNVEAFDHFFSRPFLEFARGKIKARLKELASAPNGSLSQEERELRETLDHYQYVDLEHHIAKVERGKAIMRSPEFYEVDKCEWALNAFREVMEYISLAYYPANINFYPVESNLNKYRPWVSGDLLKAADDDSVNIYADVCRQLVWPAIEAERPDVVGVSIGTSVQLMSGITICRLIKRRYPGIHVVVGGNVITRLKGRLSALPEFFAQAFDSMIVFEGEHALVQLVRALSGEIPMAEVPNCTWRDAQGNIRVNELLYTEKVSQLPVPDFDGLPWEKYFSPEKLVPYLGTRGCYWGKCTFCDHGAGYIDQYRAKHAGQIADELELLARKHQARHFIFTDESFPPSLFIKLPPLLIEKQVSIFWTTLIRFESGLLEPELWDRAWQSGCRSLYYGLESANERIIHLVKKDTKIDAAVRNLQECKRVGIWTHVMGFFGFPTETLAEGDDTRRFLLQNRGLIDSVEMYFFVLYRNAPIWTQLKELNVKVEENPEHDLALDFYYTPEQGITIPQAMQRYEDFYRNDYDDWAMRINAREHVFLYITHYGTKELPQLYVKNHPESQNRLAPEVMM